MQKTVRRICKALAWTLAAVFLLFFLFAAVVTVSEAVADNYARTVPAYPREDISPILEKAEWTAEDYGFLYRQTGLGASALDALRDKPEEIYAFQEALYYEGDIVHKLASFATPHDCFCDFIAPIAPLESGDVIVSSTTHSLGWRHGHAALVIDGKGRRILESVAPGVASRVSNNVDWFRESTNFIVLRPMIPQAERAAIVKNALDRLTGLDYSILAGIFDAKDQGEKIVRTNCTHLVWQAFWDFGYDIDPDGGKVCTSRDIANSPLFEIVQVYGFDPMKYW